MSLGFGYETFVGWGTEGTYGTPASAAKFLEINSVSLAAQDDVIQSNSVYRSEVDVDNMKQGRKLVSGNVTFDLRRTGAEQIFKYAMGTVSSAAANGTLAYKHTFGLADALPTGLTFEVDRGAANFQYHGCKINTLALNQDNSGILEVSADIIAEDEGTVAASTPTFSATEYYEFDELVVEYAGTTQPSTAFSLSLNNNLTTDRFHHGSRYLQEPQRADRIEVTGEMTCEFDGTEEWNKFQSAGTGALTATWTGATISGTTAHEFKITCPYVRLAGGVPEISDSGMVMATIPFVAYANGTTTNTRSMKLEWTNTQASV